MKKNKVKLTKKVVRPAKTTLELLRERFETLSPQERNDRLQILYAARCEELGMRPKIGLSDIELMKVLMESFKLSLKFDEASKDTGDDPF